MPLEIRTTWQGAYLIENGQIRRRYPTPTDPGSLRDRIELRRQGLRTPEEEQLIAENTGRELETSDRRIASEVIRLVPARSLSLVPILRQGSDTRGFRTILLSCAERALEAAWDPSIHVQEAVRAMGDLDQMSNLLGERLSSWVGRDAPEIDSGGTRSADHSAEILLEPTHASEPALSPPDPELVAARRRLAELYRTMLTTRTDLERAVERTIPTTAPNVSALLGPLLTARLLSQAGGLDRLARLPASTIQVLGAERAFFEHLRGHAPPPRHGLLFLHPDVQSAPRRLRGKLARTIAGKVAIAARKDHVGAALDPALGEAIRKRVAALRPRSRPPPP